MRALVVDDTVETRTALSRLLRRIGFDDILTAEDGRDALDQVREAGPIDLALVDWYMPNLDGVSTIRALRSQAGFRDVPILMVTGESDLQRIMLALSAGADDYVTKPFDPTSLRSHLLLLGLRLHPLLS